ncbi:MAG: cytochrome c oxidase assembly protein subunit 15, partial [Alphaproteobacteria bacterium]
MIPSKNISGNAKWDAVFYWLMIIAAMIIAMVIVGGFTRLTGSGLSITQWKPLYGAIPPLNLSQWMQEFKAYQQIPQFKLLNASMTLEEFKYIFWWEWGHR